MIAGAFLNWSDIMMFILCCISIIGLSGYIGRATESLAIVSGPRIGGLLNATFGNAVELIISIFTLKAGMVGIVLASLRALYSESVACARTFLFRRGH